MIGSSARVLSGHMPTPRKPRPSSAPTSFTCFKCRPVSAQVWDERIGSARVQARSWRWMAFGCLGLALVVVSGLLWQLGRSTVTPYVVEVDTLGQVRAVGPALEEYQPTDAQIAHELERFIRNVRSLPLDPVVLRADWLEAYDYATARGATTLNAYAREHDPF